ncbi:MAG: hypothetical protein WKF43_16920 [Acidimicrobiales bacterium]
MQRSPQALVAAPAAFAEAERLEAAGQLLDAIATLSEANRIERNSGAEEHLVQLRHEAFAGLDRRTPTDLPPAVTRASGRPGPLPELSPSDLTVETLRAGLASHGCVLIRGLVSSDRAAGLVHGIDAALSGFDAGAEGAPTSATTPWYAPFTPRTGNYRVGGRRKWVRASGAIWTADSPQMLFELLELVDDTGIGALVTEYLGERPALSANKCTLRRVPVTSNTDWYQDGAFLGAEVRTLNLWLGLSDCGTDAPGLDIVPRRLDDVVETGTDGAIFDWAVSPELVARLTEDTPVLRPEFAPGDALLFDHLFLHRTAIGPDMTRERHAIETWFFAPSAYPDGQIPLVY